MPSKTKTQANSLVRLGYDVCVRQNLVFRAIFGSVSDDKYFFGCFLVFRLPVSTHGTTQELTSYENLLVTKILDFLDGWQCYLVDI